MEYKKVDENRISRAKMNLEEARRNTAYQRTKMARLKGLLESLQKENRKMGYSDKQAMDGLDQANKELKKETDEYERLVDEEDAMRKQLHKAIEKETVLRKKLHKKTIKVKHKKVDENLISQAKMNLEEARRNTAYQRKRMGIAKDSLESLQKENRKMGYSDEQAMDGLDQANKELKKETDEYERLVDEEDAMRKQLHKAIEKETALRKKLHRKTTKVKPECRSGKERIGKNGRCVKPKTTKVKPECRSGKERIGKNGRCVKPKTTKVNRKCKDGKKRNAKGRCVKRKEEDFFTPPSDDEFHTPPSS